MKFVETAVEIEKCTVSKDTKKIIRKFGLLSIYFHVNLCSKIDCKACKLVLDYVDFCYGLILLHKKRPFFFHSHCRHNRDEFYSPHCLLLFIAQSESEKTKKQKKLNDSLKNLLISQYGK